MWKIWRAPNYASKWQMGFNSAFKGLIIYKYLRISFDSPSNGTRWFIIAFKSARHLALSCASSIQSILPIPIPEDPP